MTTSLHEGAAPRKPSYPYPFTRIHCTITYPFTTSDGCGNNKPSRIQPGSLSRRTGMGEMSNDWHAALQSIVQDTVMLQYKEEGVKDVMGKVLAKRRSCRGRGKRSLRSWTRLVTTSHTGLCSRHAACPCNWRGSGPACAVLARSRKHAAGPRPDGRASQAP